MDIYGSSNFWESTKSCLTMKYCTHILIWNYLSSVYENMHSVYENMQLFLIQQNSKTCFWLQCKPISAHFLLAFSKTSYSKAMSRCRLTKCMKPEDVLHFLQKSFWLIFIYVSKSIFLYFVMSEQKFVLNKVWSAVFSASFHFIFNE